MSEKRSSLKPLEGANRSLRRRLNLKGELLLALAPTVTVLGVLGLVEVLSQQRLLFASLSASAFLIYLDKHDADASDISDAGSNRGFSNPSDFWLCIPISR